jgi:hypothetical protein
MVFDHFQDVFDLEDFTSKLFKLHHFNSHVAIGCFQGSIACVLGATRFLALAKPLGGIKPC